MKKSLSVGGVKVHYQEIGAGQVLLFLHGGRVQASTFKRNLALLSSNFLVIAPDIPGYGRSGTPATVWSFADYASFFDLFLRELNLQMVVVMGYSMGGGIACSLAARSERVARLILIDSAGLESKSSRVIGDLRRLLFYLSHPQFFCTFAILLKDYIFFLAKHIFSLNRIIKIRSQCMVVDDSVWARINVPTLIVWGDDDWIFPTAIADKFHKNIKASELKIVQGNHDWILYDIHTFSTVLGLNNPR